MTVYIAMKLSDGSVKIGTSGNVKSRLSSIAFDEKSKMLLLRELDGSFGEEKWMHIRFSDRNICGEWFQFDPEMMTVEIPEDFQCHVDKRVMERNLLSQKVSAAMNGVRECDQKIIEAAAKRLGMQTTTYIRYSAWMRAKEEMLINGDDDFPTCEAT